MSERFQPLPAPPTPADAAINRNASSGTTPTDRSARAGFPRLSRFPKQSPLAQYLITLVVVLVVTGASFELGRLVGHRAIALLFLFVVVVLGSFVSRGPTLFAAALSAVLWDYFFLAPIHSLWITSVEDGMLFGMYFVVALALGQLTTRIRAQEEIERRRQQHATTLFLLTRELAGPENDQLLSETLLHQMAGIFDAQTVLLLPDAQNRLRPQRSSMFELAAAEEPIAAYVFEYGRMAGKHVTHLPGVETLLVPLASGGTTAGVLGLRFKQAAPPHPEQIKLLEDCAEQIAQALNRLRLHEVSEQAQLLAESERLSKALLDSMSHEIRTPIAAIKSATSNLIEFKEHEWSPTQLTMIAEIQEATERLNRLVGNVLDLTRLESGAFKPKLNECDVSELIHVAVTETERELAQHKVTIDLAPGLPMVRMNFVLLQQALTNLLSNAAFHTPPGTTVNISARVEGGALLITVADDGPGLHAKVLPRLFEKFHRGPGAPAGGSGLGLSLVKGFVEAHGGRVKAANGPAGGAVFTISIPLDKIPQTANINT